MPTYAKKTQVSSTASREEIERILARYGASSFMYGWEDDRVILAFKYKDRMIRYDLKLPPRENFRYTEVRQTLRSPAAMDKAYDQAVRQKWRALTLVIKAKLEAVESDISTFEEEFLAKTVLPSGQTVGDGIEPQIQQAIQTGAMPTLLLPAPAGSSDK